MQLLRPIRIFLVAGDRGSQSQANECRANILLGNAPGENGKGKK